MGKTTPNLGASITDDHLLRQAMPLPAAAGMQTLLILDEHLPILNHWAKREVTRGVLITLTLIFGLTLLSPPFVP